MGMPLEMNWLIVTKGQERKLMKENYFELTKEGYRLYPLDIEGIEVRKQKESSTIGLAIIKGVQWKEGKTTIVYELKKLKTVN